MRKHTLLVLFFCFLTSCSFVPQYFWSESLAQDGHRAVSFPSHWTLAKSLGDADFVFSVRQDWQKDLPAGSALDWVHPLKKEYWAAAQNWDSPTLESGPLKPLEGVSFPQAVVPYQGLYPGDTGYPWIQTTSLQVRLKDDFYRQEAQDFWKGLPPAAEPSGLQWVGFVGDVMPGRGTSALLLEDRGPEKVFMGLLNPMRGQDFLIANLETAVTERGTPWPKTFRFRIPKEVLGPLMDSGIDLVTLANNHIYDYQETGLLDTLDALGAAEFSYVGAGRTWEEASRSHETLLGTTQVKIWNLGAFPTERTGFNGLKHASIQRGLPGLLWADERALAELENQWKGSPSTFKIVTVHAGTEYEDWPNATQTRLFHRLIDAGADLVVGHHPHVLQPLEWYQGPLRSGLIVYSLGNYVFDDMEVFPKGLESLLVSVGLEGGKIRALRLYEARLKGPSVDLEASGEILARVLKLSQTWKEKAP